MPGPDEHIELSEPASANSAHFVVLGHQLLNWAFVVAGSAATLRERWDDLGPEQRDRLLVAIEDNAMRMSTMAEALARANPLSIL